MSAARVNVPSFSCRAGPRSYQVVAGAPRRCGDADWEAGETSSWWLPSALWRIHSRFLATGVGAGVGSGCGVREEIPDSRGIVGEVADERH